MQTSIKVTNKYRRSPKYAFNTMQYACMIFTSFDVKHCTKCIKTRSKWSIDAIKMTSCPLLWLVIMSSDWSAFPLIGQNILLLVSISSDWSKCSLIDKKIPSDSWSICPPIGYHALWLVIMLFHWSSCHHVTWFDK